MPASTSVEVAVRWTSTTGTTPELVIGRIGKLKVLTKAGRDARRLDVEADSAARADAAEAEGEDVVGVDVDFVRPGREHGEDPVHVPRQSQPSCRSLHLPTGE